MNLLSLWAGGDRLRVFKADLQEDGSYDEAVKDCDGVFHVAASMEFNVVETDNIGKTNKSFFYALVEFNTHSSTLFSSFLIL